MKIEEVLQSDFKSNQVKAVVNLRYTSNFLSSVQNKYMSEFDLSMAQFNILRILRGAKSPLTVNTVKARMIEKSPNTTRLLDKLLQKELIVKIQCEEDKRQTFVEITKTGLQILSQIDQKSDLFSPLSSGLNDQEAQILSDLLDKLRSNF
ncbi:MAG: MarR family 2-MHQ and catechol resistance regulon transcriptional repressor [Psychromonas sp.]|jgi:MarR family 2-MHQ and catechol resistance regulon transcriptional repressor